MGGVDLGSLPKLRASSNNGMHDRGALAVIKDIHHTGHPCQQSMYG
jgi:hypothetical protein